MDVSAAVDARRSVRAFLPTPVPDEVIADLLTKASRAPSGGNVQPWRIYVIGSGTMPSFLRHLEEHPSDTEAAYDIYPQKLWDPYRTNRFELGEQMYALLGIERDDRAGRLRRFDDNYRFFDAPAAIFCFIERKMGPPQWSDLGMFLQTFMLLAVEAGLDTCPQEAWAAKPQAVASFVGAPPEEMIFCGVAIGHAAPDAPVNSLRSERMPLDRWATFVPPEGELTPSEPGGLG
ncbi:MAG: nitroreductase [Actinomycetota bacterium]|nr:nitroreductase [Actinomycetota bacterium]